jgi:hypothetical protein
MTSFVRIFWPWGMIGTWDHGFLERIVAGDIWPTGIDFYYVKGMIGPGGEGGIVVLHGARIEEQCEHLYIEGGLSRLPWALILHMGDEEMKLGSECFRGPRRQLWLQAPNPFKPIRGDKNFLYGYPEDCRTWLRGLPRHAASGRRLWGFSGQTGHVERDFCISELRKRDDGELKVSGGFGQGLSRSGYYALLADVSIAPCPAGPNTPETFRLYESLEAGCMPIASCNAPAFGAPHGFDYFQWRFKNLPFPRLEDWRDVHAILDALKNAPEALQDALTRCQAWWIGQKRDCVLDLLDAFTGLSVPSVSPKQVTVLMPTSPCPSHPSTDLIADSIGRLRAYPECKDWDVIIMVDGVPPWQEKRANDYREYKRVLVDRCNWDPAFKGCWPLIFEGHHHQAGMTREALRHVRTPLVFFQEHDTWPCGSIDWSALVRAFEDDTVNYVRLNLFDGIHPEHVDLYPEGEMVHDIRGAPLLRTLQWSQRPHLARTDFYRGIIKQFFGHKAKTMIEDVIWGAAYERLKLGVDPWQRWGMYVYHPAGANKVRSGTSDGRRCANGDLEDKGSMHIEYDGERPVGAPAPGVMR